MVLNRSPDLVVFDWDGTLSDSRDRIVACFHDALAAIGVEPATDDVIRGTIGLELPDAAAVIMPDADRARCLELTEAYRSIWLAPGAPRAKLFDGARSCLEALSGRGLTLAVATGKSRRGLDRELAETELGEFFAATRTADETRGKPHPMMLLELLAELGVAASAALMVGDTTFDLEMANNATVPAVAVASGTHSRADLLACQPKACIPEISGFAALLAR